MLKEYGIPHDPPMSNRAEVFVWLTIILPREILPSVVTEAMRIQPSEEWVCDGLPPGKGIRLHRGEDGRINAADMEYNKLIRYRKWYADQNFWRFELEERLVCDVAEVLMSLVDMLLPHATFLRDLTKTEGVNGEIGLAIYTFAEEGMPILSFNPKLLTDIASLGVGMDFDLYHLPGGIPERWRKSTAE